MLATGGTIASKPTENGLVPQLTADDLIACVPELAALCQIHTLEVCHLDSTDMTPAQWAKIALTVQENYAAYDGFVVCHGTDTMSYAAAALSYMIQNSPKPVVLTGSQKSVFVRDTDARNNLIDAFVYATDPLACGVRLVFNGKVILGTRARKVRTRSFNAFDSIDYPEIAVIRDHRVLHFIRPTPNADPAPHFSAHFDNRVVLLKLIPGLDVGIIDYLSAHTRAVIVEGFGMGGLPDYAGNSLSDAVGKLIAAGVMVIMATQVPHEGSNLSVYAVGQRAAAQYNLLETGTMTLEASVMKTMWALGGSDSPARFRQLFFTPVENDLLGE